MAWDPVWETVFRENEWGKYPSEDVIRFVARNFYSRDRSTVKILEVGCGPGANIWYLSREGFEAHGVDGSETAIRRCGARLAAEGLAATLHVGDIASLPYSDDFFDAVLDIECLYANSLVDTRRILTEIARVLKPGGRLFSRSFANDRTLSQNADKISEMEYRAVHDGPLHGKGFIRLLDRETIDALYGAVLKIEYVDKSTFTRDNGGVFVSEWEITCVKSEAANL